MDAAEDGSAEGQRVKPAKTGLMEKVITSVTRRGTATVDDLMAEFPEFSRVRIHAALANARDARKLRIKVRGSFKLKVASVWEAGAHPTAPSRRSRHAPPRPPIASVWELGTPRVIPMPQERGRIFNLLGDWNA